MIPATDEELFNVRFDPKHCNVKQARRAIYNLGLEHGKQQAAEDRPQWPTPIAHRRPTEADADPDGGVQWLNNRGHWFTSTWDAIARDGDPWQHTSVWTPKPPTLKEQALEILTKDIYLTGEHTEIIRRALEARP